jgi:hypothetical protein
MKRGWTSADLIAVGEDDTLWTVAEAARLMGPLPNDPPTLPPAAVETKLRILTCAFHLQPCGKRRTSKPGRPGRYARVYHAQDIIELYEMLNTALGKTSSAAV